MFANVRGGLRVTKCITNWACMPMVATDPCKIGVMGSTPMRSTEILMGSQSKGTTPLWHSGDLGSIPGGSTDEEGSRIRFAGPVC